MHKFDSVPCIILSDPIVETEQPFMMTFNVWTDQGNKEAAFFGEFARQLRNNVRTGDKCIIREATVHGDKIGFMFMHLSPETAIGRNTDLYG